MSDEQHQMPDESSGHPPAAGADASGPAPTSPLTGARFAWPTRESREAAKTTGSAPMTDYDDTQAAAGSQAAVEAHEAAVESGAALQSQAIEQASDSVPSSTSAAAFSDSGPVPADPGSTSGTSAADAGASGNDIVTAGHRDAGAGQSDADSTGKPAADESSQPPLPAYLLRGDTGWTVFKRIVRAKTRFLTDRLSRGITDRTLRIGISARIFHPQPGGKGLQSKTLQYLEESIAHWVMTRNALVFMVPTVDQDGAIHPSNIRMRDYARTLDGLVLQGGADVSPMSYSQTATKPEWNGDRVRDLYELELLQAFIDAGKPVLGICRGCQLINVAFGGTLHQDIATELPHAIAHVNDEYDANWHEIRFTEDSTLPGLFGGQRGGMVNSIHHQSVNQLGRDLSIEAVSADDQVVEAIRLRRAPFVVGLQWHPEFHGADKTSSLLNCTPILDQFLRAARETRF